MAPLTPAALAPAERPARAAWPGAAWLEDQLRASVRLLSVFAQVVFARSRWTGLCLLLASATDPLCFAYGALAVAASVAAARWLGLAPASIWEGPFGYNALLIGAGVAASFAPGLPSLSLALAAAGFSVLVTASLSALLPRHTGLPVLSLPFILVFSLLLGVAPSLGLTSRSISIAPADASFFELFLESLGMVVFAPRPEAGMLVLLGLLIHSRIAALLAFGSFALVTAIFPSGLGHATSISLALNGLLAAMALGGVYYVPSTSSFLLGAAAASSAALIAAGIAAPFARLGVPPLILPFNLAVLMTLSALRLRLADDHPKVVDFEPGSPEENLYYYRTRLARFDALYPISFRLPFRGFWECTQGVDGDRTHQGPWRHAYDFEVSDASGAFAHGQGHTAEDHHCFRLPVLAAADGTVAKVIHNIPDNAMGVVELEQNWGNLVLVYHAPGLYSLVAHLALGSVRVVEGQFVRRGEVLGACGNSGRSPRPHLHFQLQGSPVIGAPTLPCRFQDIVLRADRGEQLSLSFTPGPGDLLRNLEPGAESGDYLPWLPGEILVLQAGEGLEHVECQLDLLGRRVLRSVEHGTVLYFDRSDEGFTVLDVLGPRVSALYLLRAALSRVPFDSNEALRWRDFLPPTWAGGWLRRLVFDFLSPFLKGGGVAMEYQLRRESASIVVEGTSTRKHRSGEPALRTRATLTREGRLASVEVQQGRTIRVVRAVPHPLSGHADEGSRSGKSTHLKASPPPEPARGADVLASTSAFL